MVGNALKSPNPVPDPMYFGTKLIAEDRESVEDLMSFPCKVFERGMVLIAFQTNINTKSRTGWDILHFARSSIKGKLLTFCFLVENCYELICYKNPKICALHHNMLISPYNVDPVTIHFYVVKLGCTGVCIFPYFCFKHRLLVLVRTASRSTFRAKFEK